MTPDKDIVERLKILLDWSYMRGQAMFESDRYGRQDDEYQDWMHYEEEGFQAQVKRFIKDFKKVE